MKEQSRARITPAAVAAFAAGNMDNFRVAATPGGIEAQEAAGQVMFVNSATLPKDMGHDGKTRAALEALGFKFGTDADDIFINAVMPAGWKKVATEHSVHSDLIDDKGRRRGGIFYKAAFYDRNAHMRLCRRYVVSCYENCNADGTPNEKGDHSAVCVMDCGKELWRAGVYSSRNYKACELLEVQARKWLIDTYPNADDVTAYWD